MSKLKLKPWFLSLRPTTLRATPEPTKSFQAVIEETDAQSVAIRDYFQLKRERGTLAVPKPVLNGAVVRILTKKIENCVDMRTNVACLVMCLEEFSSNHQVVEPWGAFYQELSNLFDICLQHLCEQDLTESSKVLNQLCNTILSIAGKDKRLSSELFNKCAEKLLKLVFKRHISQDLRSLILSAMSDICQHSNQSTIFGTLKKISCHFIYLAKMILDLCSDTQICIYILLSMSVLTIEEAQEKASIWFYKWPGLQEAFIEGFSKNFSEGCGHFLNKLFEMQSSPAMEEWKRRSNVMLLNSPPSRDYHQSLPRDGKLNSVNGSSCFTSDKIDVNSSCKIPASLTAVSRKQNEADVQDKPAKVTNFGSGKDPNAASSVQTPSLSQANGVTLNTRTGTICQSSTEADWRKFQTPYYPDRRKSLALRKKAEQEAQSTTRKTMVYSQDHCSVPQPGAEKFTRNREHKDISSNADKPAQANSKCNYDGNFGVLRAIPISSQMKKIHASKISNRNPVLNLGTEGDRSKVERWLISSPPPEISVNTDSRSSFNVRNSEKKYDSLQNMETDTKEYYHDVKESKVNSVSNNSSKAEKLKYQHMQCSHKSSQSISSPYLKSCPKYDDILKEESDRDAEIEIFEQTASKSKGQKRSFPASANIVSKKFKEVCSEDRASVKNSDVPLMFRLTNSIGQTKSSVGKWTNFNSLPRKTSLLHCRATPDSQKRTGKRALFSESKENWNAASPPPPHRLGDGGVRSPLGNVNFNSRPVNRWEQRLRELEEKRKLEKMNVNDIYKFDDQFPSNLSVAHKKASRAPSKKSCVTQQSHSDKSLKMKNSLKATKIVRSCSSAKPGMKKSRVVSGMDTPCLKDSSINQNEKKGQQSTALKSTVASLMKEDQAVFNSSPSTGRKSTLNRISAKLSAQMPQTKSSCYSPPFDDSFDTHEETRSCAVSRNEKIAVVVKPTQSVVKEDTYGASRPKSGETQEKTTTRCKSRVPIALSSEINNGKNTQSVSKPPKFLEADDGMKALSNKSRDIDSGIDITSASECLSPSKGTMLKTPTILSNSKQTKPFSLSQFLQSQLRDYLECAKKSNEDMASNQTDMSLEILEIKRIAEKLAQSAGRCKVISENNQKSISEQTTALSGCSKFLGPYEDQTFPAVIPTKPPIDYEEFTRQYRAYTKKRMMDFFESCCSDDEEK